MAEGKNRRIPDCKMPPKKKVLPPRAAKDVKKEKDYNSTGGARAKENISKSAASVLPAKPPKREAHTGIKFIGTYKKQTIAKPFNFARRGKNEQQRLEELFEQNDETIDLATPDRSVRRSLSCSNLNDLTSTVKPEIANMRNKPQFSVKDAARGESLSPIARVRSAGLSAAAKPSLVPLLRTDKSPVGCEAFMPPKNVSKNKAGTDNQRFAGLSAEAKPCLIPVLRSDRSPIGCEAFTPPKKVSRNQEGTDNQKSRPMGGENYGTLPSDKKQAVVKPFRRITRSQKVEEKEGGDTENKDQNEQRYVPKKITRRRQELV